MLSRFASVSAFPLNLILEFTMTNTVVGVFDTYEHANSAKQALEAAGFNISDSQLRPQTESTQTARGTSGMMAGNTHEHGMLHNFFSELFGDTSESKHADYYAEAVRRGSYVLAIDAADEAHRDKAVSIMEQYNPIDIEGRATAWQATGWTGYDKNAARLNDEEIVRDRSTYGSGERTAIPVIEESLQVGKREVQRGGVRVFQRVIETPVSETVGLREERITVERHAVDQPASAANLEALKEGSFELREMAEEAVVAKTARVVWNLKFGASLELGCWSLGFFR